MFSRTLLRTIVRTVALALAVASLSLPMQTAAQADNYTPRGGATFNNPIGSGDKQRAIFRHLLRSINSTPRGEEIHIFSWNFLTADGADALLRAQRRNVRVRVLMDTRNRNRDGVYNTQFARLKRGLNKGNRGRDKGRRSWARVCERSCRGRGGTAHSKFYLFSRVGKARQVFMQGSTNFTKASTTNQWNDIFTHKGQPAAYKFGLNVFKQATKDRPRKNPYATTQFGSTRLMMFPSYGSLKRDPLLNTLKTIRCRGARNTRNGRTNILVAPDAIRQSRGMALAKKMRALWQDGCDVRIGYTVMGVKQGRYLRREGGRGPVPLKHLVQDFDGDGDFDNYFHMKSLAVRGNVGGDRSGNLVFNGSANWSGLAKGSDENMGIYRSAKVEATYRKHIDYWYKNFPSRGGSARRSAGAEDQLIFGFDENAVYEDGTSVTDGEFDPFQELDPVD